MDVVSRRLGGLVGLAVAIAVLWAGPAPAITNPQLDGEGHPNVGALLADLPNVGLVLFCSGSVLSPTEFLTAGHCTQALTDEGLDLPQNKDRVFVSFESDLRRDPFDGTVAPATKIQATGWVTHPAFNPIAGAAKAFDVGVVHLAAPVERKRKPVTLPAVGFLDAQAAGGGLRGHIFEAVGYGRIGADRSISSPNVRAPEFGLRFVTTSPFMSLTPDFLKLQGNTNATGLGGVCFGDSGGPAFWAPGTGLEVAVPSAVDPTCGNLDVDQRLDIAPVLDFLAPFRG